MAVFLSYFKVRQQIRPHSLPIFVIDSLGAVTRAVTEGIDPGWQTPQHLGRVGEIMENEPVSPGPVGS